MKQAVKKGAGVKKFSVQDFKKNLLGKEEAKSADKEMEWIIMPKAIDDIANDRIRVVDGKVVKK